MTSIQVKGPLNNGTSAVKNQSDLTRSRVQLTYLVTEADAAVSALPIDSAITAALGSALLDNTIPKYGGIVRQNASARRVGPKKVEVTITLARSPAPPTPSGNLASFQTRSAEVRVYRLPYNLSDGSPAIDTTSGLPIGDFADFDNVSSNGLPQGGLQLKGYPYPVQEIAVTLPAKLSSASFDGLLYNSAGSGGTEYTDTTAALVNKYNDADFTWGTIKFQTKHLRFDSMSAQWVSENGVFVYYVNYNFTWRPRGWYMQNMKRGTSTNGPSNSNAVGYQVSSDFEMALDTADFTGKFPLS